MKKQRYIVEIEMPDEDFISAGWLKNLIQTDCDVEDESRKKVTVQETSLPSNLDEAARKELQVYLPQGNGPDGICYFIAPQMLAMYKAGAEYMAGQGVSMEITPEVDWTDIDKFVYKHSGDNVIIQIRKRKEKEK